MKVAVVLFTMLTFTGCSGTHAGQNKDASLTDLDRGRALFTANCAVCHGPTGVEGGVGPSLHNLRNRMDRSTATGWIEDPQPPMPKLYPKPLRDNDVRAVATYVTAL